MPTGDDVSDEPKIVRDDRGVYWRVDARRPRPATAQELNEAAVRELDAEHEPLGLAVPTGGDDVRAAYWILGIGWLLISAIWVLGVLWHEPALVISAGWSYLILLMGWFA